VSCAGTPLLSLAKQASVCLSSDTRVLDFVFHISILLSLLLLAERPAWELVVVEGQEAIP